MIPVAMPRTKRPTNSGIFLPNVSKTIPKKKSIIIATISPYAAILERLPAKLSF